CPLGMEVSEAAMASRPESSPSALRPPPGLGRGTPGKGSRAPAGWRWWQAPLLLALVHLTQPAAWGRLDPGLWYPPAGLGLALVAWFGPRAALVFAADGLALATQAALLGSAGGYPLVPVLIAADTLLGALEL